MERLNIGFLVKKEFFELTAVDSDKDGNNPTLLLEFENQEYSVNRNFCYANPSFNARKKQKLIESFSKTGKL